MTNETKIYQDTVPLVLYTMIDCQTFGELRNYLDSKNIVWKLVEQSDTSNTIRLNYKGHNLFHNFEILN